MYSPLPGSRAAPSTVQQVVYAQPNLVQAPVSPAHLTQAPLYLSPYPTNTSTNITASPRPNGLANNNTTAIPVTNASNFSAFEMTTCIEILSIKDAELEKTVGTLTSFEGAGLFRVLYFAEYDKFVLSLNNWKYVLFKNIPITGTDPTIPGSVKYRLPNSYGYHTLTLNRYNNSHSINNLETILRETTRFSTSGAENVSYNIQTPGQQVIPASKEVTSYKGSSSSDPNTMGRAERVKRGFQKFGSMFSNKDSKTMNLNHTNTRDFESIKKTNQVFAPVHSFSKKDVERWITFNQEVCRIRNFDPQVPSASSYPEASSSNNVSFAQGAMPQSFVSQGITSERVRVAYNAPTSVGVKGRNYVSGGYYQPTTNRLNINPQGAQYSNGERSYVSMPASPAPVSYQNLSFNNSQRPGPIAVCTQYQPQDVTFTQSNNSAIKRLDYALTPRGETEDFSALEPIADENLGKRNKPYPSLVNRITSSLSSRSRDSYASI